MTKRIAITSALFLTLSAFTFANETQKVLIKKHPVSIIGGAKIAGGDTEMDTDKDDVVDVEFTSDLKADQSKNRVVLHIDYVCKEYKGNNTQLRVDKTVEVYTPPDGWTVKALSVAGNSNRVSATEQLKCKGDEHGFNDFSSIPTESYWDKASYKVDSANKDDAPHVGIKGELTFTITIEKD